METYQDDLNTCLLHRNRQLTKQLKDYHRVEALTGCSSPLLVAMGQRLPGQVYTTIWIDLKE